MSTARPLVSLCIPTYNRPETLAVVVDDLLAQTYPHIEIVVTDDGDPEPTRRALARFGERVRYHANPKRLGIYGNWNKSIELARGEIVGVYHDHDRYSPTIVEKCVAMFERSPRVGIVHTAVECFAEDRETSWVVLHENLPEIADGRWFAERQADEWWSYVGHGGILVRRDLYTRHGGFDESKGFAADMDMLVRYALDCDVGYVREPLYHYSGRAPGDTFFEFRWYQLVDHILVRRSNYEHVYAQAPEALSRALSRLARQVDERLVHTMLHLTLHQQRALVEEGWPIVARFASRPTYLALRALLSDAAPMRLARKAGFAAWTQRKAWRATRRAGAGA